MRDVQKVAIRLVAGLSFLFAIVGVFSMAMSVLRELGPGIPEEERVYMLAFWSRTAINALFLVFLAISARYLWKFQELGLRLSNILFTLELAYIFGEPLLETLLRKPEKPHAVSIVAATAGIGDSGIVPQLIVLYPVVALLVLNSLWPSPGVLKADGEEAPGRAAAR